MALAHKNRHGGHQEVHVGKFRLNEVGLVVGSVQRHRPEDEVPASWEYLSLGKAPEMGVPCVGVERDFDVGMSMGVYTYSYQGTQSDASFDDRHTVFELDMTMSEDPIETHPNFAKLKAKYGWLSNLRRFPEFMPGGKSADEVAGELSAEILGLPGPSGGSSSSGKRSAVFGVDSYLAVGAIFTKSYVRGAIPPSVLRGIGAIGTPPGIGAFQLPRGSSGRNWIKLAPLIRKKGNSVQISERWMLSGPRGWLKDVYGLAQLEKEFESAAAAA